MESVKWWQSDTMKAVLAVIIPSLTALIIALCSLFGHPLDTEKQLQLTNVLWAASSFITLIAGLWAGHGRLSTTTVIQGSSGEKSIVEAGQTVTPKV